MGTGEFLMLGVTPAGYWQYTWRGSGQMELQNSDPKKTQLPTQEKTRHKYLN